MLNSPHRKVLTLCPPENASYRRKDDGYSVNTEVHGGSRAIAVRKGKDKWLCDLQSHLSAAAER